MDDEMIKPIIDCIYEAVCVVDENGIVIVWNNSAENLYNVSHNEIIGKILAKSFLMQL